MTCATVGHAASRTNNPRGPAGLCTSRPSGPVTGGRRTRTPCPWQHLAMPATFRAIAFVAPGLDARTGRTLRRAHRTMSEPELAEILRVLRLMPESVAAWSEGTAGFDAFEIRVLEEAVRRLSPNGPDRFWVGPRDIASVIDRHVARGRWDN